jgi:hypothetical protein
MAFRDFEEFWPFYVGEHRSPINRALHYFGTAFGYSLAAMAAWEQNPWFIPLALACGYGPAWVGHFIVERNRPATFQHPIWSFRGDARMLRYFLTGRMSREFARLEAQGFQHDRQSSTLSEPRP